MIIFEYLGLRAVRTATTIQIPWKSITFKGFSSFLGFNRETNLMGQRKNLRDSLIKHKFLLVWRERKLWPLLLWTASPPQEFWKKMFHLSGYTIKDYHITCYEMKDRKCIFQLSFIAESDKKFSAKRFFNLSQTIFRSP